MLATILLTVLNAGLIAAPIGGTAGVLSGVDYYRQVTGQTPLFSNPGGAGGGNGGGGYGPTNETTGWDGNKPNVTTTHGGVTISEYCQQYATVLVNTTGQNYTLNPNQWGWTKGTPGSLCLNVTTNNNDTYATNTTAPKWTATWQYPEGPSLQPVHAFPNIEVRNILPAKLGSFSEMGLDVQWAYETGGKPIVGTASKRASVDVDFSANVAIDMFFDSDPDIAQLTDKAEYEVMVWFGVFGKFTEPVGQANGILGTQVVQGLNFTLYGGINGKNQTVLTWICQQTATKFNGNVRPLLTVLPKLGLDAVPVNTDYIGYFAFGSEAYYSPSFVTFDVQDLSINIW